jgi:hypothetical protein
MTDCAKEECPGLLTQSGKFRYRYRPSQNRQGIDIYANGRVLMTSVFEDVFDLTRNNQYNYFGGTLQIIPMDDTNEVPTDNKKTRLDTNSELWREIQSELSTEEFLPEGREYGKQVSIGGASEKIRHKRKMKQLKPAVSPQQLTAIRTYSSSIMRMPGVPSLSSYLPRKYYSE